MADRPVPPPLGDETEIFLAYHPVLRAKLARAVRTSEANLDDAVAFAWSQFLLHQPDRTENRHQGWLFTVAQREAWRLHRVQRDVQLPARAEPGDDARDVIAEEPDPRQPQEERLRLREAIDVLKRLPERDRRVAFLKATGYTYAEIGELTGKSPRMTDRVIRRASLRIYEVLAERAEAERPTASPRAARLAALERDPPEWLTAALGRRPGDRHRQSDARKWLRAVLAIDDYRQTASFHDGDRALGVRPDDPAGARRYDTAVRSIEEFRASREQGRGRGI